LRIGLVLAERQEAEMARLAEEHGLFGVLAGTANPRTAITAAAYASTATDFVRIAVRVELGLEHPVTIAEELSILDNTNNGRTVVVAGAGSLSPSDAADELAVIQEALGNHFLQHEGPRWKAPAGLPANVQAPKAIAVTPKPAQIEIPFWLTDGFAPGLPVLARELSHIDRQSPVQPATVAITGSLEPDRDSVASWAAAGATHLFLELPADADRASVMTMVSRYLAPEVGMPHFPRVMSHSRVPLPWPGDGHR
jgi:luciferase-like monooxygenase